MKNNCEIIRELLPLYCDDVCSEASKKLVEEHIGKCALCKAVYENLKKDTDIQPVKENEEKGKVKVLKSIKKKIILKRIVAVVIAVAITAGAGLLAVNKLWDYYPVEYYYGYNQMHMMVEYALAGESTMEVSFSDNKENYCI
ncbi:MAG: zf-HC2 domain-containing protein, partial [Clostridia bacterium]|nr:zf-HC2 domain-containing protein [Clostridia bacterium]